MKLLYNKDKWLDIWNLPKYQEYREKIIDSFKDLIFVDEGHKYFLNGKELLSVSVITHKFVPEFDSEVKAVETFERNYDNPESKYYHMSVEEIKKAWDDNSKQACEHGTERHEFGESAFYFMTGQYDKIIPSFKDRLIKDENGDYCFKAIYPKEEAVVDFYTSMPKCMVPILAETKVFNVNDDYRYSGTFDILFYYDSSLNKSGKKCGEDGFYILDYKTNKDLYKNFKEGKMLSPFDDALHMPLNTYKLQLGAYQLALETINLPVRGRVLLWLKPDGTFEKKPLEDISKKLDKALRKLRD